jgi:hypothetical protein
VRALAFESVYACTEEKRPMAQVVVARSKEDATENSHYTSKNKSVDAEFDRPDGEEALQMTSPHKVQHKIQCTLHYLFFM